ncbi:MAG: TonB-dependent receptor [Candidatus Symbiothrix sp.]|jgi:hypothetical protein|nr:TonB-dependent receptor [Candidatus Symbiothrix sp.]
MKTKRYIFSTIAFAVCFMFSAQAQIVRNDSLLNREMTLEKEYNPTIKDAVKLNQLPELREPQATKSKVEFSNYAVPYEVKNGLVYLKPQTYLSNINYSKYRGYLTAGLGTLMNIDADLGYQLLNSGTDHLSVFASHRSGNNDVTNLQIEEKQKFKLNDTWGGIDFLHNFGTVKFGLDAKYTYASFNYSGLSSDSYVGPHTPGQAPYSINTFPNQANNMLEIHTSISSEAANKMNYKINAVYTRFDQKYYETTRDTGRQESRILIDWDFHKNFNSTMGSGFAGFFKNYAYASLLDWLKEGDNLAIYGNSNYSILSLNPYFYLEGDNLDLTLGGKIDVEFGGRDKVVGAINLLFNYYPSDYFLFYVKTDGGRKDNSNYASFYENRYISPYYRVWDSRTPLDGTVGLKFLPVSTLSLDVFGGYKITMDEHFYFHASNYPETDGITGTVLYPEYQNANTFKVGADIKYALSDLFEVDLKGVYYQWEIKEKQSTTNSRVFGAWHKPRFVADLNTAYRVPLFPLRFDLSYHAEYGRKSPDYLASADGEIVKMKDIHDLSLKATYPITDFFSAYLYTNNLLFQKYDIWYGYPAQNFNIMGGISFLF